MVLPDLPQEIVRKIFAYNILRNINNYYSDIAALYNVSPTPFGTYQFLRQFSTHSTAIMMIYCSYGYCPDF